jgi:phospholipase D-like protein/putative oligomerization/nucleic acid binding protein
VLVGSDYPFLDVMWTMLVFFVWIAWFMLLFRIIGDIFRRKDIGGGGKTLWMIFVIVLPFLGVFVYLVSQNDGMTQRTLEQVQAQQSQMDDYVRSVASTGSPAAEIEKAQGLLDSGAISQSEYEALKAKALAT